VNIALGTLAGLAEGGVQDAIAKAFEGTMSATQAALAGAGSREEQAALAAGRAPRSMYARALGRASPFAPQTPGGASGAATAFSDVSLSGLADEENAAALHFDENGRVLIDVDWTTTQGESAPEHFFERPPRPANKQWHEPERQFFDLRPSLPPPRPPVGGLVPALFAEAVDGGSAIAAGMAPASVSTTMAALRRGLVAQAAQHRAGLHGVRLGYALGLPDGSPALPPPPHLGSLAQTNPGRAMFTYLILLRALADPVSLGGTYDILADPVGLTQLLADHAHDVSSYWADIVADIRSGRVDGGPQNVLSRAQRDALCEPFEPNPGRANLLDNVLRSLGFAFGGGHHRISLAQQHSPSPPRDMPGRAAAIHLSAVLRVDEAEAVPGKGGRARPPGTSPYKAPPAAGMPAAVGGGAAAVRNARAAAAAAAAALPIWQHAEAEGVAAAPPVFVEEQTSSYSFIARPGPRPHACRFPACGATFGTLGAAVRHMRLSHGREMPLRTVSEVDSYLSPLWASAGMQGGGWTGTAPDAIERAAAAAAAKEEARLASLEELEEADFVAAASSFGGAAHGAESVGRMTSHRAPQRGSTNPMARSKSHGASTLALPSR
jgi:hypothetical protein